MATTKIVLLPGDGIGPEIVAEARKVLEAVAEIRSEATGIKFEFVEELLGGCAIDKAGVPLPPQTLESCKSSSAILLGAVGGPQWPRPPTPSTPNPPRPEQGLLELRKSLDLYANIRPCSFPSKSLVKLSPLKESVVEGTEFVVVRELTGGDLFWGEEGGREWAHDTMSYSIPEVQRITRIAAALSLLQTPPAPIISIDKANVLATSRLWRKTVTETLSKEFPTIPLSHNLVDSAAMLMVMSPRKLNGILLTENMFGDILSDESSVIPGSLGLLPSASLSGWGKNGGVGLYEPCHGSAPDIAGQGIANPIGTILSAAMLLRYSLGLEKEAAAIEQAVRKVLDVKADGGLGLRTKDLGGETRTVEMGNAIIWVLKEELKRM